MILYIFLGKYSTSRDVAQNIFDMRFNVGPHDAPLWNMLRDPNRSL